ncbi:endonuclease MutS2 [Lachnoclostridium sp. An138]|uniref:endonuclease MutS2 n=1 Tax=Lachnoclostridium sp. An138 TaxID=1965560 RepID=UPI000B379EB0|nr:endonuclease MutS2 [Lachnoclostridium sp. An138]OUQ16276.1 endonuclease MutS2 [Lachnoclostridium sp. An138]
MNRKAYQTLEFYKITERLAGHAASAGGRKRCLDLVPMQKLSDITASQTETADALSRVYRRGSLYLGGAKDVRPSLKRLEVGSSLNIMELLDLCTLLETAAKAKQYARQNDGREEEPDTLDPLFSALEPCARLSQEIRRCILSEEEISDDASPALRSVRRSIRTANDRIHSTLSGMVNGSARTYLQDAVITQRNGRYCIPVKAEYRSQVPGMIHDQSSTGSTLFVEPMAVVRLNNDLKELYLKEQEEIEHVLEQLSQEAASCTESIAQDYEILTELDFIFAKANLAREMKATCPVFNEKRQILIKEGRHPLLDPSKVVPVTIRLGQEYDLLIVTGPNTGGKTVSLKTTGLLTLMGQAGLHIPAAQNSQLAVFDEVYADIGDEQSIEQSLSTFSSHMTNIIRILKEASLNSLVLFDELCAGTDPTEGAALAIAILSHLHKMGIRTMATTHYSELKVFALSASGVENACCEFDVETLSPTYRLLIGIPGKSNAFAISSKLGLPDFLIEDARGHLSEQSESFEDLLADLESSRRTIEQEQEEIREHKEEIRSLREALEKKQEKLDAQRDRILREANEQARKILQEAKDYADQTMKDFHKFGKAGISASEMEAERARLRERMKKTEKALSQPKEQKPRRALKPSDIHLGDTVRVLSLNLQGTVSSLPDARGSLFVQMGILRSQVKLSDLELVEEAVITSKQFQKSSTGKIKMSKSASVSTEINLIGMTVDEALAHLDKYLDDAYLAHLPSVRIVHGKGTGALRKAVQGLLKRNKYVKSYRLGEFGEGDAGVTIATFKQE